MSTEYYFVKSRLPHKKYTAVVLQLDSQGRPIGHKLVHFGDSSYQHFRDQTGVNAWSHLDHGDETRRQAYHRRHRGPGKFHSPGYFSWHYLW